MERLFFALGSLSAFIGVALGAFAAHAQESLVTGREIQETWVGKTMTGTLPKGGAVTLRLKADGSAAVSAGTLEDTGTWRAVETGYCASWKQIRRGEERCFTVRRSGTAMTVSNPDGSLSATLTEIR